MSDGVFFKWCDAVAPKVVKNLKSRQFEAYYCKDKESAVEKAIQLMPKDSVVSWGGAVTLDELGMQERLRRDGYTVIDRDTAKSPEERQELMHKAFFADVYLTSTNAISEDGILVNVDGTGNRVAAMCYGPKSVIVFIGLNKLCKTEADAVTRARNYAAPMNVARLGLKGTACAATGSCIDCKTAECVCSYIVTTRFCRVKNRIKVILVGESIGY